MFENINHNAIFVPFVLYSNNLNIFQLNRLHLAKTKIFYHLWFFDGWRDKVRDDKVRGPDFIVNKFYYIFSGLGRDCRFHDSNYILYASYTHHVYVTHTGFKRGENVGNMNIIRNVHTEK